MRCARLTATRKRSRASPPGSPIGKLERVLHLREHLRPAQLLRNHFAIRADEECRGDAAHAVDLGHFAAGPIAEESLRPGHLVVLRILPGSGGVLIEAE